MPGEFYAEVSYICADGFDFDKDERNDGGESGEKFNKLYCSEGRWEGRVPECLAIGEGGDDETLTSNCQHEDEVRLNCDHSCVISKQDDNKSSAFCKCHVGYTLNKEDERTCLGIYHSLLIPP